MWRKWFLLSYSFIWDNDIEMLLWDAIAAAAAVLCFSLFILVSSYSQPKNIHLVICIKCHHNLMFSLLFYFILFFSTIKKFTTEHYMRSFVGVILFYIVNFSFFCINNLLILLSSSLILSVCVPFHSKQFKNFEFIK